MEDVGRHATKAGKDFLEGVGDIATVGDMFLNLGTGAVGLAKNFERRLQGIGKGEDSATTSREAKKVQDEFQATQPDLLKKLVRQLTPEGEEPKPSHVEAAMSSFIKMRDSTAAAIHSQTNGLVKADDLIFASDMWLTALGFKPLVAGAKAIGARGAVKPGEKFFTGPEPPPDASPFAERMAARKKYTDDAEYAQHFAEKADAEAAKAATTAERMKRAPGVRSPRTGTAGGVLLDEKGKPIAETPNYGEAKETNVSPDRATILRPDGKIDDTVIGQRS